MSTTTSNFQIKPNFFSSVQDCLESERKNENTNPKYKFFNQTHFTAGDIEQFEEYRDNSNDEITVNNISMEKNIFKNAKIPDFTWEKYRELTPLAVTNTFNYIFHKFKKGIFVKIKNGKMRTFLPFSNKNFTNEWYKNIQVDPKEGNIYKFLEKIQTAEGRKFNPNSVNKFTDSWYANNCLLRWEFPIQEGDTNIPITCDMFITLCQERIVPDMEFFVNRRDFPIIKKDGTEAYEHLFGDNIKLLSHSYEKYAPIFSMVRKEGYADIPIPTGEDWARVTRKEGKFFPKTATRQYSVFQISWDNKKPIAVFRGSSTGSGVTIDTNPRLKVSYLSKITPHDVDGNPLIDAGITEWNLRPRKIKNNRYLQTIDFTKLPFGLVNRLTPQEQFGYKYIINIDGHVSAYRLSLELESGSCILLVASKYKLWYTHMLKPFVHYVPVEEDLSDLVEKIRWCKANDSKCKKIAENAVEFSKNYLTKEGILDYLQKLFYEVKKFNGIYFYNIKSVYSILEEKELQILKHDNFYPKTNKTEIYTLPIYDRCYGLFKGIEWLLNMIFDKKIFSQVTEKSQDIINNNMSIIAQYKLAGVSIVEKVSSNIVHEAFVTIKGTNELIRQIPNFAYTFGFQNKNLIMEYINGENFYDFIKGKIFNIHNYISILLQISLALHVAQKKCGFVHHNLIPQNVIIQTVKDPVFIDYVIDYNTIYRVKTKLIPIIVDMSKSHIIHENLHYGRTNLFSTNTIQDVLRILNISIYEVLKLNLLNQDVKDLIKLSNFFSFIGYRKSFKETGQNGLGDIRYFFGKYRQHPCEIQNINPIDFANYILNNFKFENDFTLEITDTLVYHTNIGNPRQVFDFAFCKTPRERALSYARSIHRIQNMETPELSQLFQIYYFLQTIDQELVFLKEQMLSYLKEAKIEDSQKFIKKYEKTVESIKEKFIPLLKANKDNFFLNNITNDNFNYEESIFLFPKKILFILQNKCESEKIDSDILELIEEIMIRKNSFYSLTSDRKYYETKFTEHINNRHIISNYITNLNTIRFLTKEIYTNNIQEFQKKINNSQQSCFENSNQKEGSCPETANYIDLYKNILKYYI